MSTRLFALAKATTLFGTVLLVGCATGVAAEEEPMAPQNDGGSSVNGGAGTGGTDDSVTTGGKAGSTSSSNGGNGGNGVAGSGSTSAGGGTSSLNGGAGATSVGGSAGGLSVGGAGGSGGVAVGGSAAPGGGHPTGGCGGFGGFGASGGVGGFGGLGGGAGYGGFGGFGGSGGAGTVVVVSLDADADAYIYAFSSSNNYGALDNLWIRPYAVNYANRAVVYFDLGAQLPLGATITSAYLCLTAYQVTHTMYLSLNRLLKSWAELEVTWSHATSIVTWNSGGGDYQPTATGSLTVPAGSLGLKCFDATADVQDFYANPSTNAGWLLRDTRDDTGGAGESIRFRSREYGVVSERPKLDITYVAP